MQPNLLQKQAVLSPTAGEGTGPNPFSCHRQLVAIAAFPVVLVGVASLPRSHRRARLRLRTIYWVGLEQSRLDYLIYHHRR